MLLSINIHAETNDLQNDSLNAELNTTHVNKWNNLINAIIHAESKGNPKARHGQSVGILQITPIMVKQCNQILKERKSKKRYTLQDRLSVQKSKEIFYLIQNHYNPSHNIEKAIIIWNKGPYHKGKKPYGYINRIKKRL